MIERERRAEVGDRRGVAQQAERVSCVAGDGQITVSEQHAKARRPGHSGFGTNLSNRERCRRAHRTPFARERAINQRKVELASVGHREETGVEIHLTGTDSRRQSLPASCGGDSYP